MCLHRSLFFRVTSQRSLSSMVIFELTCYSFNILIEDSVHGT